jgi:hypothetical protein
MFRSVLWNIVNGRIYSFTAAMIAAGALLIYAAVVGLHGNEPIGAVVLGLTTILIGGVEEYKHQKCHLEQEAEEAAEKAKQAVADPGSRQAP